MFSAVINTLIILTLLLFSLIPAAGAQAPAATPEGVAPPSYDAIVEKDLFRAGRKKWVPPLALPPLRPLRPPVTATPSPAPRPEPEPKFVLHGVALTSDGTRIVVLEEAQLTKGKILPFRVGDKLGPYQIKEIHSKGTVLERSSKTINLMLAGEAPPQTR